MSSSLSKPPLDPQDQSMFRLGTLVAQPGGHPLRVAQSDCSGEYAFRPTAPDGIMGKLRPSLGQIEIIEPPSVQTEHIQVALSMRPIPVWTEDPSTPPTLSALSVRAPDPVELLPSTRDRAVLIFVEGPNVGEVVSLPPDQLIIGRNRQAGLHVPEAGVSRRHARICFHDGGFLIEDLGSHNGTSVGGRNVGAAKLRDGDVIRLGAHVALRFSFMDLREEMLLRQLYQSSVRDALTGAFNRRHFSERLSSELAYATRHKSELSILLLDIDFFKEINDKHGHLTGDRVLKDVTLVCSQQLRTEDTFARYGGEEFVVLLRGIALSGAARAAERLRVAIFRNVVVGPADAPVGVSLGCASLRCLQEPSEEGLFRLADERLYQAKRAGRGRVVG